MIRASLAGAAVALLSACSERPPAETREFPDPDSAGAALLQSRCGTCHVPPLPSVHTADAWAGVVHRMQARMRSRGYPMMPEDEQRTLLDYLRSHAATEEAAK